MTDSTETSTETTTDTTAAAEQPETTTETTGDQTGEDTAERPAKREARYRVQLRETEAERDTLRERVETMQRAEAERIAGQHLAKPAALWATGTDLPGLLDEHGNLDADRVTEAAQQAAETLGVPPPRRSPRPDLTQGAKGAEPVADDRWSAAFRAPR